MNSGTISNKAAVLRSLIAVLWLAGIAHSASSTNFTSFDFPGAIDTQATAITPSGNIVGRYTSSDGKQHGFLLASGKFRSIDFPGATATDVTWINPRGQIVGGYVAADGKQHGFLLSSGRFSTIDYPAAQATTLFGLGANGDMIGIQTDAGGNLRGFLLSGGSFTTVDVPGATFTIPAVISGGRIAGGYGNNTGLHGFVLYRGVYQTIDCPGATFTFLSGIDPQGRTVGGYGTYDGAGHGALINNGSCMPVEIPGSSNVYANGLDPQGDIVGRYTGGDGVVHGFLLKQFVKTSNVIYSAAHDFSFTLNPNSVWSYGFANAVGDTFVLYTVSGSTFSGCCEAGWFGPLPGGANAPGFPLVVAQPGVIPGVLDLGPGWNTYTVVRWTAPSRGRWDVVGQFFGTGLTTADVHVLKNGTALLNSPLNGFNAVPFSLAVDVAPGDTIDFVAGPGTDGNPDFDSTGFNVTITPEL